MFVVVLSLQGTLVQNQDAPEIGNAQNETV
jgi:hypothetical protein